MPASPDPLAASLRLPCGLVLRNRIAKAAMSEQLGDRRQSPGAELPTLYARWVSGGIGLAVTGNVMVDRRALGEPGNVALEDGRDLARLRAWAAAGTAGGAQLWMQLNHPGRQSPRFLSPRPVAPSAIPLGTARAAFATPRALGHSEIREIVERFAASAGIAKAAGFTGVQVHGAHGYLVNQFLSPLANHRTDCWGGSLKNRMRFALEIVRAIRAEVGPSFAVGVKLNSADFQRGGFSEDESAEVVQALAAEEIDLLEVSGGTYESTAMMGKATGQRASTRAREAYFLEYATRVRDLVDTPLMLTGGFRSPAVMRDAVASGVVDVVGLARPLCIDPDFPRRALGGDDTPARAVDPRVGIRLADSLLQIAWHTQQLQRMGRGDEPSPGLTPWRALATAVRTTGVGAIRRTRA